MVRHLDQGPRGLEGPPVCRACGPLHCHPRPRARRADRLGAHPRRGQLLLRRWLRLAVLSRDRSGRIPGGRKLFEEAAGDLDHEDRKQDRGHTHSLQVTLRHPAYACLQGRRDNTDNPFPCPIQAPGASPGTAGTKATPLATLLEPGSCPIGMPPRSPPAGAGGFYAARVVPNRITILFGDRFHGRLKLARAPPAPYKPRARARGLRK